MNAMNGTPGEGPNEGDEPPIVLVGIENSSYYLYRGDDYIDQLLLADGDFPKPVMCLNFGSVFDAKRFMGEGFSLASCWAIHPEIVKRLRDEDCLIEPDE